MLSHQVMGRTHCCRFRWSNYDKITKKSFYMSAFVKCSDVSLVCPRKEVISVILNSEILFSIDSHSPHALSRILCLFLHVVFVFYIHCDILRNGMGGFILLVPSIWAFYQCFCIYSHIEKSVQIKSEEKREKAVREGKRMQKMRWM